MILAAVVDPASMLANAPAPSDGGRPSNQRSCPNRRAAGGRRRHFATDKE
jgi:hypothetical protein